MFFGFENSLCCPYCRLWRVGNGAPLVPRVPLRPARPARPARPPGIRLRENNAGVRENDWESYDEHAI